jgi:hypothetical protein
VTPAAGLQAARDLGLQIERLLDVHSRRSVLMLFRLIEGVDDYLDVLLHPTFEAGQHL